MHIPDGFLNAPVCLTTGAVSAAAVGGALRKLHPESDPGLAPRMGVTAAYLFAAQMVNFPVAAGTSGHLLGALLAAVLLGPHAGAVAMAAVFVIQTFFFLDGGHTALGANVLNMGLAGTYGGYAVYRALAGPAPGARRCLWAAGAAAWVSVMLGAALTSAQLAFSGSVAPRLVFPAMLGVHAVIGLGEGAITAAALALLWKVRPDLITGRDAPGGRVSRWGWAAAGGLALVAALASLASSAPDGLEWVAERLGFHGRAADAALPGPFPDYTLPPLGEAGWAAALVSALGAGLMVAAVLLVVRVGGGHGAVVGRVDPRVKLACLLLLVTSAVLMPLESAHSVVLLALLAGLWVALARVSLRWLAGRALLLVPFLGLVVLSLPQLRGGGVSAGGFALLKALTSLLATAAFLATTPESDVLAALAAFRVPRAVRETIGFALRYLRVVGEEAGRMLQARAARTAGAGTLALRAGVTGGIVGSLFVRSYEKAERISQAMVARGYPGTMPGTERSALSRTDWVFAAGFALLLMGVWLWR